MLFAGIDPGSRHIAACLIRRIAPRHELVRAMSLDVDITDPAAVRDAVRRVLEFVDAGIVACGVETVGAVHGSPRMGSAYAAGLAGSNLIAGRITQAIEAEDIETMMPSAGDWKAAYCGTRSADDAAVASLVRMRVEGWPKRSNAHERDAAAVALWTAETWAQRAKARMGSR